MHNFKPGDLALIIGALNTENVGKVVEVLSWHPPGERFVITPGGEFNNRGCNGSWMVCGDLVASRIMGEKTIEKYGVVPIDCLMPLRGDFKPDEDDLAEYAETSFYDLRTGRQHLLGGRA